MKAPPVNVSGGLYLTYIFIGTNPNGILIEDVECALNE